jgi:hypothetical protein
MSNQHPITPPPELVFEWCRLLLGKTEVLVIAAQWGADRELEACCEVLHQHDRAYLLPSQLRAARRPKPTLKEVALEALERQSTRSTPSLSMTNDFNVIRRALEALPDD